MHKLKQYILILILTTVVMVAPPIQPAHAVIPAWIIAIIKKGVTKVIKAIDLMVQRLQNETLALQNIAKQIENKLSETKLKEIAEWTERQRSLYKKYYEDLWKVRNTLAQYQRIRLIVKRQQQIVSDYQFMWHMVSMDNHFTREEIDFMYRVYTGILNDTLYNIEQLLGVINSYRTQMSDADRLEVINTTGDRVEQNYADLQQFNTENVRLSLSRAKDEHEVQSIKKLYGLQ